MHYHSIGAVFVSGNMHISIISSPRRLDRSKKISHTCTHNDCSSNFNMRDNFMVKQQRFHTVKNGVNSLQYQGARVYNNLSEEIKQHV